MNQQELARLIRVARGELPADLILANARIVNTFNGMVEQGNVAVCGERIAGIGDYRDAKEVMDMDGCYVAPGFINGHTHIESSMLHITQYARAVVPRGTLAVVTDLHEIANVCGLDGAKEMLRLAEGLPLDVFLMVPSCVPATPLETSGARIGAEDIQAALQWRRSIGLGEVMDFPAVLGCEPEALLKLSLARSGMIDGHAAGLTGRDLNAYVAAGIGSDHECTILEEAQERLARGLWVMIREGSSEKNLAALLPAVTDKTFHRCLLVVDDCSCEDLLRDGDIDGVIRKAIHLGLDPVRAIQMATINAAQCFRLKGLGAVAPGYYASLVIFSSLAKLDIRLAFYRGRIVGRDGQPFFSAEVAGSGWLRSTVRVKPFGIEALRIPALKRHQPVIEVVPGQITTRMASAVVQVKDGEVVSDTAADILKLAVIERHKATGNIGVSLVKGFGLKRGALASSIAHDSHNIIVVGVEDRDMLAAVNEVERMQGGLAVASEGSLIAALPLPIAGLLSDEPLENVVQQLGSVETAAAELGCTLASPFSILSFLALPVIPHLRLTDLGLVDVDRFELLRF
ncbi:MAG: adenine deaminase [Dehalococcoidia bacterium]|nr:adenine deaminase [Dehalococcoidia bacterium]